MENTTQLSHRASVFTITPSLLLERAAYYGLRSILVLYMTLEAFDSNAFTRTEAIKIYGFFTGALIFCKLIGGLIGDFLLGSKTPTIIGIFLQALGAFALSVTSTPFLFGGIGLILLGGGLYSPNLLALFGKQYGDRKNLADSGFMMLYVAINIGAFIGILLISTLGEKFSFSIGFIVAGALFLLAGLLAVLSKDDKNISDQDLGISVTTRTLNVLSLIAATGIFWWLYELSSPRTFEIQSQLTAIAESLITRDMWQHVNTIATLIGGIALIFIWSRLRTSPHIKVAIGFFLAMLAILVLYLFPPAQNSFHVVLLGGTMLLLSAAELLIAPTVLSSVARYVNPKYMATAMALTFIPSLIFQALTGLLGNAIYQNQNLVLLLTIVIAAIVGGSMLLLHHLTKEKT